MFDPAVVCCIRWNWNSKCFKIILMHRVTEKLFLSKEKKNQILAYQDNLYTSKKGSKSLHRAQHVPNEICEL